VCHFSPGWAKNDTRRIEHHRSAKVLEFLFQLSVAQASLAELQTQIEIASRLEYIDQQRVAQALDQSASLSRQLYALRNSLLK